MFACLSCIFRNIVTKTHSLRVLVVNETLRTCAKYIPCVCVSECSCMHDSIEIKRCDLNLIKKQHKKLECQHLLIRTHSLTHLDSIVQIKSCRLSNYDLCSFIYIINTFFTNDLQFVAFTMLSLWKNVHHTKSSFFIRMIQAVHPFISLQYIGQEDV